MAFMLSGCSPCQAGAAGPPVAVCLASGSRIGIIVGGLRVVSTGAKTKSPGV